MPHPPSFPSSLPHCRVAIAGLGLMGGSLALALRGQCERLLGSDPDPMALRLALESGAVDEAYAEPAEAFSQADLIVLAAPVNAILELLGNLDELAPQPALVLDLGSIKLPITSAMQGLPRRFDPVGGHPMCGKEQSTIRFADVNLFRAATFAFTAMPRTSPRARALAEQLATTVGARPIWVDAASHDRWVASTSHLPYLVAHALASSLPAEAARLIGPGFLTSTRLAASFTPMMMDVLSLNRDNVLAALEDFQRQLNDLKSSLHNEDIRVLKSFLTTASTHRKRLVEFD